MKLERSTARIVSIALLFALPACGAPEEAAPSDAEAAIVADSAALMPVDAMIDRAKKRDYWPDGAHDWRATGDAEQARTMTAPACADFAGFMFPGADADQRTAAALGTSVDKLKEDQQALRTDGVIVIKGGTIVYEHYVGPYAGHSEKRHCMWSASKSFTTGMMGALIQSSERLAAGERVPGARLTRTGHPLALSTPLSDIADLQGVTDDRIARLTVEDLLSMNLPTPAWNEGYDGNISTSSVVKMLWTDGARDMGKFAMGALLGTGHPEAGSSFRYSSGSAVIFLNALKQLYGADYDRLPWTALFDQAVRTDLPEERDERAQSRLEVLPERARRRVLRGRALRPEHHRVPQGRPHDRTDVA